MQNVNNASRRKHLISTHPLANRLGIWQIKWELEDQALRYLEPDAYQDLVAQLDESREERERYISKVVDILGKALKKEGIKAVISGRPKHINSIWRKMQRKQLDFDQIFDMRAVRILVKEEKDCYAALGIVHGLWRHIPKEFDDYIANPKENLYRSLHTAVVGPEGHPGDPDSYRGNAPACRTGCCSPLALQGRGGF